MNPEVFVFRHSGACPFRDKRRVTTRSGLHNPATDRVEHFPRGHRISTWPNLNRSTSTTASRACQNPFIRVSVRRPYPIPTWSAHSPEALALLDLDESEITRPELIQTLAGNQLLPGMDAIAMLYAGHQFGHYVPQLGDGRAILLGEVEKRGAVKAGKLQLKGAGQHPLFARRRRPRRAALQHPRIPVFRGHARPRYPHHPRAVSSSAATRRSPSRAHRNRGLLTRLAPSHRALRLVRGVLLPRSARASRMLADYVIAQHYPELAEPGRTAIREFLQPGGRSAPRDLMAQWQAVGFSHGVMNTDNMSILGLTLDYGPFGFMEAYRPRLHLQPFRRRRALRLRPAAATSRHGISPSWRRRWCR